MALCLPQKSLKRLSKSWLSYRLCWAYLNTYLRKEEFELAVVTMLLNPNLAAAMYQRLQILEEGDNEVRLYSMFTGEEHLRNPFSPHMRGDKDLSRELDPETSKMIGDFFDALDQNKFRLGNSGDNVRPSLTLLCSMIHCPSQGIVAE